MSENSGRQIHGVILLLALLVYVSGCSARRQDPASSALATTKPAMNQHCPDRAQKARAGGFVGGVVGMVAGTLIGGPVVGVLYQVAGYVVGFASADVCHKPAPSQDKEALLVESDRYPTTVITEEDL